MSYQWAKGVKLLISEFWIVKIQCILTHIRNNSSTKIEAMWNFFLIPNHVNGYSILYLSRFVRHVHHTLPFAHWLVHFETNYLFNMFYLRISIYLQIKEQWTCGWEQFIAVINGWPLLSLWPALEASLALTFPSALNFYIIQNWKGKSCANQKFFQGGPTVTWVCRKGGGFHGICLVVL